MRPTDLPAATAARINALADQLEQCLQEARAAIANADVVLQASRALLSDGKQLHRQEKLERALARANALVPRTARNVEKTQAALTLSKTLLDKSS